MSARTRITLDEARAMARELDAEQAWFAEQERYDSEQASIEAHYTKRVPVPAGKLVTMWETGTNENGKPLSEFEFEALCAAWYLTFGDVPPEVEGQAPVVMSQPERDPLPADDAMLSPRDVVRITGVSLATLKRMVNRGTFPPPLRPSARRTVWTGKDVRVWLEALHDQRRNGKRPH